MNNKNILVTLLICAVFAAGLIIGSRFFPKPPGPGHGGLPPGFGRSMSPDAQYIRERNNHYKFISPLLDSSLSDEDQNSSYYAYESSMVQAIKKKLASTPKIISQFILKT